jgi:hypothetical protein
MNGASNAVISGSFLKKKALCIATRLGVKDFRAPNGWSVVSINNTPLCTKPYWMSAEV